MEKVSKDRSFYPLHIPLKVKILVAGGCRDWCEENPAITDAEIYDPDTDTWSQVADLPVGITRFEFFVQNKLIYLGIRST